MPTATVSFRDAHLFLGIPSTTLQRLVADGTIPAYAYATPNGVQIELLLTHGVLHLEGIDPAEAKRITAEIGECSNAQHWLFKSADLEAYSG
jgi:hypothetical protein